MSEFKFACPVCGQHITADSTAAGTQLDCPTCFRKIIAPQAPAGGSNLILSATQVSTPRPTLTDATRTTRLTQARSRTAFYATALFLVFLCAASTAFLRWRGEVLINALRKEAKQPESSTNYPAPSGTFWTMDLAKAVVPNGTAGGTVHGNGFLCEKAILQGGTLSLRQGKVWPPDLGVSIHLFATQAEDLNGKTLIVRPDRPPPVPAITVRWKDEQKQPASAHIDSGYAMRVVFGQASDGRMPGTIYIALPDESKSFAAGSFEALIRKPTPKVPATSPQPSSGLK